jgi:hypothetical protein
MKRIKRDSICYARTNDKEFKYELLTTYRINVGNIPNMACSPGPYIKFIYPHTLCILAGYRWDGATYAWDTKETMRASLVHDALYQAIRMRALPLVYRAKADELFLHILQADGVSYIRAVYMYAAVRLCGGWFV